eukprot:scaffold7054_cov218-Alexandrium_tamarense.AAC.1
MHPSRYEMQGESLRGMEYLSDLKNGRRRQLVKDEMKRHVLAMRKSSSALSLASNEAAIKRSQEALAFAKRNTEEDATEAASILSQDSNCNINTADIIVSST